jgi:LuxR family maltose regulon positive regulatory protein
LAEHRSLGISKDLTQVLALAEKLLVQAKGAGHVLDIITNLLYQALILDSLGRPAAARQPLYEALALAEPGSMVRVFLDMGAPMYALLQKALAETRYAKQIRHLLVAFANERTVEPQFSVVAESDWREKLTEREFEVLQLIAAGLSNQAIQEALVVSMNTVRTHIKNLYAKLGVNSRTQAIKLGREHGLID